MTEINRAEIAKQMRENREKYMEVMARGILELTVGDYEKDPVNYFHVGIITPEAYDKVIAQLEADVVTPEEAYRKSLVWPRIPPTLLDCLLGRPNAFYRNW